jgi:pyruvate dehydrogenase phosphatase
MVDNTKEMLKSVSRRIVFSGGVGGLWNHCHSNCEDQQKIVTKTTSSKLFYSSFPANNPCEDRILIHDEANKFQIYGVFDGHGGWQVSDYILTNTPLILAPKLQNENQISVEKALKETFFELERNYITSIQQAYQLGYGEVGKVGSCVNLSIIQENQLTVANSGDCRTIIGTELGDLKNSMNSTIISYDHNPVITAVNGKIFGCYHVGRDHNARTSLEQYLLSSDHPNESNIVKCKNPHACYVKGRLQLTRAIGDLYLKSNDFNASSPAR